MEPAEVSRRLRDALPSYERNSLVWQELDNALHAVLTRGWERPLGFALERSWKDLYDRGKFIPTSRRHADVVVDLAARGAVAPVGRSTRAPKATP